MGGRGSSGSGSGSGRGNNKYDPVKDFEKSPMKHRIELNTKINENAYDNDYKPYADGQITRYEAGVIYRNVREGNINALPETTSYVYQLKDLPMGTLHMRRADNSESYKDSQFFQQITKALMSKDYSTANKAIREWELDTIKRSGKKSAFAKYK